VSDKLFSVESDLSDAASRKTLWSVVNVAIELKRLETGEHGRDSRSACQLLPRLEYLLS
jgi:hypothetical protein